MSDLKSIKLYFFSIIKLIILRLKFFFYKSSYYNKKLISVFPERIFYTPSSHLTSSLIAAENEIYTILNIPPDQIWEEKIKNRLKFNNLHSFLWLTKIDRKNSRDSTQSIIRSWLKKYYNYEIKSWIRLVLWD